MNNASSNYANVVHSSPILVNLMMGAIHSSQKSGHTEAIRRNVPEYGIPHKYNSSICHEVTRIPSYT
jgi:hypothetical protein